MCVCMSEEGMKNVDGENLHMLSTQNRIVWVCMCAGLTKDMHPCMGECERGCSAGGYVGVGMQVWVCGCGYAGVGMRVWVCGCGYVS